MIVQFKPSALRQMRWHEYVSVRSFFHGLLRTPFDGLIIG